MVQDSYSESHVYKNSKNEVVMIQSYTEQDSHQHGTSDAINQENLGFLEFLNLGGFNNINASLKQVLAIPGTKEAIEVSTQILSHYKAKSSEHDLELYLRNYVYKFGYMDEDMSKEELKDVGFYDRADGAYRFAGGSLNKFKPKDGHGH